MWVGVCGWAERLCVCLLSGACVNRSGCCGYGGVGKQTDGGEAAVRCRRGAKERRRVVVASWLGGENAAHGGGVWWIAAQRERERRGV